MRKASEYLKNLFEEPFNLEEGSIEDDFLKAIKQAQIDAIDEAVKMCAESAKLMEESNWGKFEDANKHKNPIIMEHNKIKKNNFGHGDCTYQIITVSKQSILQVADKLKKELE